MQNNRHQPRLRRHHADGSRDQIGFIKHFCDYNMGTCDFGPLSELHAYAYTAPISCGIKQVWNHQRQKRCRRVSAVLATVDDSEPLLVETPVIKLSETDSIRPVAVCQTLQARILTR